MSNAEATGSDLRDEDERTVPRAVLHKQILDAAERRPNASMDEIAAEVSIATRTIVERVLEEYGDPAPDTDHQATGDEAAVEPVAESSPDVQSEGTLPDNLPTIPLSDGSIRPNAQPTIDHGATAAMTTQQGIQEDAETQTTAATETEPITELEPFDLTEKQRETLEAVDERPTATQAELADELGVTSATINQRVNSIEGFDWAERRSFTDALFNGHEVEATDGPPDAEDMSTPLNETVSPEPMFESDESDLSETVESNSSDGVYDELSAQVNELTAQFETLEQQFETRTSTSPVLSDPELVHKVLHACLTSDYVSEEEELKIVEGILAAQT